MDTIVAASNNLNHNNKRMQQIWSHEQTKWLTNVTNIWDDMIYTIIVVDGILIMVEDLWLCGNTLLSISLW